MNNKICKYKKGLTIVCCMCKESTDQIYLYIYQWKLTIFFLKVSNTFYKKNRCVIVFISWNTHWLRTGRSKKKQKKKPGIENYIRISLCFGKELPHLFCVCMSFIKCSAFVPVRNLCYCLSGNRLWTFLLRQLMLKINRSYIIFQLKMKSDSYEGI